MHTRTCVCFLLAFFCFLNLQTRQANAIQKQRSVSISAIKKTIKKLKPLHSPIPKPQPGEWLATQRESGQTFAQWLRIKPIILTPARKKLYVQPIGEFTDKQTEIIKLSADFLAIYFNCEVTTLETMDESKIADRAKRKHPTWGDSQLLTSYILDDVLAPKLPGDAFAVIAFTSSDLWPGDGWNFVFGFASFRDRVGVWTIYRNGDPTKGEDAFAQCLRRTIKIATHETGHMFSIQHCIKYQCNMQGSNSLPEADAQPLHLCPECHAKILLATSCDPVARYEKLITFCQTHNLKTELDFFRAAKAQLEK